MDILKDSRRNCIKLMGMMGTGVMVGCTTDDKSNAIGSEGIKAKISSRLAGAQYMGDFAAPKLETVRCAFIGVGSRGSGHAQQIAEIEGTEVVAISDLYEDLAIKSAEKCKEKGGGTRHKNISLYHGDNDLWKKMLKEVKPDAVFICTPWKLHAPMSIEAMKQGVHVFSEVP